MQSSDGILLGRPHRSDCRRSEFRTAHDDADRDAGLSDQTTAYGERAFR